MSKQRVNITIDYDVWFYYRSKQINMSDMVNQMLRMKMDLNIKEEDERELEDQLHRVKSKLQKLNDERDNVIIKLQHVVAQREEKEREDEIRSGAMVDSIKANNPLRHL